MAIQSNMFLTFDFGNEHYGIPILQTKEIIGMVETIRVPKLPSYMNGIINLRGKIIPVMDLRSRLGFEKVPYDDRTSIIIVEFEADDEINLNGLIVDRVHEVLEIPEDNIEKPSKKNLKIDTNFIYGIGKQNDDSIIILDTNKILSGN